MPKQTINTLRGWFSRGKYPTEGQFWDWLDSFFHKDEKVPIDSVANLPEELAAKANAEAVDAMYEDLNDQISHIIGAGTRHFVCGGDDEFIWPKKVRFESITQSPTIASMAFKIGINEYSELVGLTMEAGEMLELVVNLKAGYEKGVVAVGFSEVEEQP